MKKHAHYQSQKYADTQSDTLLKIECNLAQIERMRMDLQRRKKECLAQKEAIENSLTTIENTKKDVKIILSQCDILLNTATYMNLETTRREEWKEFEASWKKWKPCEITGWMAYKLAKHSEHLSCSNNDSSGRPNKKVIAQAKKLEKNIDIDWKTIENNLIQRQLCGNYLLICDEQSELEKIGLKHTNVITFLANAIKQLTLTKKNEINQQQNYKCCCICYDNIINTVILPCSHACLCKQCADGYTQKTQQCPICRKSIKSVVKFFI